MASEPVHFILETTVWDAYRSTVEENAYALTQYPSHTIITRQDVDTAGVLTALRAIPGIVELRRDELRDYREAHPEIFPTPTEE